MATKKTSIYLDEDVDQALSLRAAEEGISKAEFIRRNLAVAAARPKRPRLSVGQVRSLPGWTPHPDGIRGELAERLRRAGPRTSRAHRVTVIADASVVVAALHVDDAFHERAVEFYAALDEDLVTTPLVLAEMDYVLMQRAGPDGVEVLRRDLDSGALQVRWWATAVTETLTIARRHPELGLADASLLALAPVVRTTRIATFDRHFEAARTADGDPFTLLPTTGPPHA